MQHPSNLGICPCTSFVAACKVPRHNWFLLMSPPNPLTRPAAASAPTGQPQVRRLLSLPLILLLLLLLLDTRGAGPEADASGRTHLARRSGHWTCTSSYLKFIVSMRCPTCNCQRIVLVADSSFIPGVLHNQVHGPDSFGCTTVPSRLISTPAPPPPGFQPHSQKAAPSNKMLQVH